MVTIVFSHPWHGSFNKAILDTITKKLTEQHTSFEVLDLHKDNFNPVITESELALYNQGKTLDPTVVKYQEIIKKSSEIIFIFPIWWGTIPAILKGFFDKVLMYNFAFNYNNGWTPLLDINKTLVISTSESPTNDFRNAIEGCMIPNMLQSVGFKNAIWLNCDETSKGTDEHRKEFLEKMEKSI